MATFNKFNSFVEALAEKVHNLGSDVLRVALTTVAPVASNTVLANLTQITYTNLSSRTLVVATSAQTSGVYKLTINDLILTAAGGDVAAFRYIVIYNDTATNDELIGWLDYGSNFIIANGQSFTIDFDGTGGLLTIT